MKLNVLEVDIRPWEPNDSFQEITELLHLAYNALAQQGLHYNASHQPTSQTQERLARGQSFVATCQNRLVGTISLYEGGPRSYHQYYKREGLYYFGQFAVHPEFQGHGIAKKLYQTVEDLAKWQGGTEIALDTAEPARDLIDTYQRWGFKIVDTANWDSTNYASVIMAKPLL